MQTVDRSKLDDSILIAKIPDQIYLSLSNVDNIIKIEELNSLAPFLFYSKPYLSEKICLKSVELALIEDDAKSLAESYKTLGFAYKIQGITNKSLDNIKLAKEYYIELNDSLNIGFVLNLCAGIYSLKGEDEKALSQFIESEKYFLELLKNDPENKEIIVRLSILYINLGLFYSTKLYQYEEAEDYFHKVIEYATQTSDTVRLNAAYSNLGQVCYYKDDMDCALEYFEKALEIAKKSKNYFFVIKITSNIGSVYEQRNNLEKSREYYFIALEMAEKFNDILGIAISNRKIGETYFQQNQVSNALKYYYIALEPTIESSSKYDLKIIYKKMSDSYENIGNLDSTLHYYKLYSDISNKLESEESQKRFEELQIKYQTDKKEKENLFLKEKSKIQDKLKIYLFVIILGLVLLAVFLIYFFRIKSNLLNQTRELKKVEEERLKESIFAEKQINQLQKEKIKHKNRELSTATLQLINKNNILSSIGSMLNSENSNQDDIITKEICKTIKENIDSDNDWEQFKLHFEEVHIGFFNKLKTDFPKLTPNELKLCAYIRINLTSKEIAQMLHNTAETINKSRYRLRKKLNLTTAVDLGEFIRKV